MTMAPDPRPSGAIHDLVLVNTRGEAPEPAAGRIVVVLDMAWTPTGGDRPDVLPVRPIVDRIVVRHNLFADALDALDGWAEEARAADAFTVDGATWWFHARGFLRLVVHELILWRRILDELAADGPAAVVTVPGNRPHLVSAARAGAPHGTRVRVRGLAPNRRRALRRALVPVKVLVRTVLRVVIVPRYLRRRARKQQLDQQIRSLPDGPWVLAVLRERSFHTLGAASAAERGDPYVSPVLDRLAAEGVGNRKLVLGMGYATVAPDGTPIADDPTLLPGGYATERWRGSTDGINRFDLAARLNRMRPGHLMVGRVDLGGVVREEVVRQARWLRDQAAAARMARNLMAELRPAALITGWEAARTSWLAAARSEGVPIVSIQHGVIYPGTPDYVRPAHPAHVISDVTCTFGPYERDLLIEQGGYAPESVVATGSPRATPDTAAAPLEPTERDAIRAGLGVTGDDRVLVVSTARHSVGDEFHGLAMAGHVLGGPLPGVHLVFKLHPEEQDGSHYLGLLRDLAKAGGYALPPMSVVRDIDIYRLLRAADAHLGHYSTVLTDAVMTGTPNMIAVGHAWADIIGYVDARVATPVRDVDDVRSFMASPVAALAEDRERFLAAHSLSGDATGRIAAVVREAIGR